MTAVALANAQCFPSNCLEILASLDELLNPEDEISAQSTAGHHCAKVSQCAGWARCSAHAVVYKRGAHYDADYSANCMGPKACPLSEKNELSA